MKQLFTLLAMALLATASAWATEETIVLDNIGSKLGSDANTSLKQTEVTATDSSDTYTLNYLQCKKQGSSILLSKSKGAFISNKTPIPGAIKSVKVTINAGAAGKTTYHCAFSTAECTTLYTEGSKAVNIQGGKSNTFTCSVKDASYFCVSLGNANNGQVLSLEIVYEAGAPKKDVKSLVITGTPTVTEYYLNERFNTEGLQAVATYTDNTTETVTPQWSFEPATFTVTGNVEVSVTATYGGASALATYPVTVKTIANTKETAYTVDEAIALIDAGKDLNTPVYVKGYVSKITTAYDAKYGNVSFNVSDDGTTNAPQFMFFRNQKDAENKYTEDPSIAVGASVVGYGTLTKYNSTYEFAAGNYLVEYSAPEMPGDINADGVLNTDDVTALATSILEGGDVTLATGDLNDDGVLDVTDVTILVNLILE